MIREQTLRARQKLVGKLPISGELLRGSLLERTVRHTKDCPKCARGEGHHVFVLTVTYPGGRTRQFTAREASNPAPVQALREPARGRGEDGDRQLDYRSGAENGRGVRGEREEVPADRDGRPIRTHPAEVSCGTHRLSEIS